MEVFDKTLREQLLYERDRRMLEETDRVQDSYLALKRERAKGIVSRQYKAIVSTIDPGCEVIWGSGGAQTKRAAEYDSAGVRYLRITNFN